MAERLALDARRSLNRMRATKRCDPPGHSWGGPPGTLTVGIRCQCGEVEMDADLFRAMGECGSNVEQM
jgi:hypothetical protein